MIIFIKLVYLFPQNVKITNGPKKNNTKLSLGKAILDQHKLI